MKVVAISDLHSNLNIKIEPADVLCICGDICPHYRTPEESHAWFQDVFIPWCNEQPVTQVLVVAGNHDFYIYEHGDDCRALFAKTKIRYLVDEAYTYRDPNTDAAFIFYGSPWCHKFGQWCFMDYDEEALRAVFDKIPENVDILLTHDAPFGVSDICLELPKHSQRHIGCQALFEAVKKKQPRFHFHGHLHTSNHQCEMINKTHVYNVSVLNEWYELAFKPLYLDIDEASTEEKCCSIT